MLGELLGEEFTGELEAEGEGRLRPSSLAQPWPLCQSASQEGEGGLRARAPGVLQEHQLEAGSLSTTPGPVASPVVITHMKRKSTRINIHPWKRKARVGWGLRRPCNSSQREGFPGWGACLYPHPRGFCPLLLHVTLSRAQDTASLTILRQSDDHFWTTVRQSVEWKIPESGVGLHWMLWKSGDP